LECNDFCAKVLRNRRLALALDIKRDDLLATPSSPALSATSASNTPSLSSDDLGYYDDTLREFYIENATWCLHMENTMIEFVQDTSKKSLHCKPMRSEYRRFLHRYAVHFNVATEAIDSEPKRSVIMRKTLGPCRVPPILLSRAARNPTLNRPPTTAQGIEADTSGRSASRQPVNALYLSDMAFGLTKLELDVDLAPLIKIGNDSIRFTSKWVNENDAVVVPSISNAISMDEKETIIWQLKKTVKAAFTNTNELQENKATRIDCCWVNQKGEVTWNEKTAKKDISTSTSAATSKMQLQLQQRFVNTYDALKTVDDDGWMKVGGDNPFRPAKDAWIEAPKKANSGSVLQSSPAAKESLDSTNVEEMEKASSDHGDDLYNKMEDIMLVEAPTQDDEVDVLTSKNSIDGEESPISDDWETLLDDDEEEEQQRA
jgi:transcriptional repressor NF-X1